MTSTHSLLTITPSLVELRGNMHNSIRKHKSIGEKQPPFDSQPPLVDMEVDRLVHTGARDNNAEEARKGCHPVWGSISYTSLDSVEEDAITMMAYKEANLHALNQAYYK